MRLEFDEEDLKPLFRETLATAGIKFEHLNEKAQAATKAVGQGTFFRAKGRRFETYTVIYAPKEA